MTPQSTAADHRADPDPADTPEPADSAGRGGLDQAHLDQAERVWSVMRDLAENFPPKEPLRAALNLGRGTGRIKALLRLTAGTMSLSELAEAVNVDAPYATLIVDTLEERGLVERSHDPADRRRKLVALTDAGEATAQRVLHVTRQPPPGFGQLSPAELDTLDGLMRRIATGSHPAS
jgi:DNA-binding MarR family transcriptional regulator